MFFRPSARSGIFWMGPKSFDKKALIQVAFPEIAEGTTVVQAQLQRPALRM